MMRRAMQFSRLAPLVLGFGLLTRTVSAQPNLPYVERVEKLVQPAEPTAATYEREVATSRSYVVPALEITTMLLLTNIGSRIAGQEWANATPDTMWHNITHKWVYDNDTFSVNQLAHPYGGALLYTSARSSGHGWFTSLSYAAVGSLLWEVLAETEPPSINDQITTTIAGAFLGEVMHRWGRAVLWGGGDVPGYGRRVMAATIDPMGAANGAMFRERWLRTPPPRLHAFIAVGPNLGIGAANDSSLHTELSVSHGLPSDPRFEPTVPFDHFDVRSQIDLGRDGVTGYLDVRGMLIGTARGEGSGRTLWGLFGTYAYWDADSVRAGAIGFGPGFAAHGDLGHRTFLEASAVLAVVPWGAAGGTNDVEGIRDYAHAPGASEIFKLEVGRRGFGIARLSARAIQIAGNLVDEGNEAVVLTSAGAMFAIAEHHALGFEFAYSARYASLTDAPNPFDQSAQLRLVYSIISDDKFGGGAD